MKRQVREDSKLLNKSKKYCWVILALSISTPLHADFSMGRFTYSSSVLPELLGDYWWEGKPEVRKYAGQHHFILNKDGSGTFNFTGGKVSSFKWGVYIDKSKKPVLYEDRYKELKGCYSVALLYSDGKSNDVCINLKSGLGILGSSSYRRK